MSLQPTKKRPIIGVGVVVMQEGKVLLGKRKGAHGEGDWSFAGGHLEFGESIEECAARELEEETGLTALSLTSGPWTEDLIEEGRHYVTHFVFVNKVVGEPQLLEPQKCEGWEWYAWKELPSPLFMPIRSLIKKAGLEYLQGLASDLQYAKNNLVNETV